MKFLESRKKAINIGEVFDSANLDHSNIVIYFDIETQSINNKFDLTPADYFKFANEDFMQGDNRGFVNSISNSKRSIDCQIKLLKSSIGLCPNQKTITDFCKRFLDDETRRTSPIDLPLLASINLTPVFLVSKIREVRNQIEHEYKVPDRKQAREALEIAELFLNNTKYKMLRAECFNIGDINRTQKIRFILGLTENQGLKESVGYISSDTHYYNFMGGEIELLFLLRSVFIGGLETLSESCALNSIKLLIELVTKRTVDNISSEALCLAHERGLPR